MSDGKAAKIIVPTDAVNMTKANVLFSETTGLGNHTTEAPEEPVPEKEDECCERFENEDNFDDKFED